MASGIRVGISGECRHDPGFRGFFVGYMARLEFLVLKPKSPVRGVEIKQGLVPLDSEWAPRPSLGVIAAHPMETKLGKIK